MRGFPTEGKDSEPQSVAQRVIEGALGKPILFDAAPTQDENSLPEGELGYFNNKIYFKVGGVLKEWAVSSTA